MTCWTEERIEQLRQLVRDKLSSSQIAAKMRVTRNSVIGAVHRYLKETERPRARINRHVPKKLARRAPVIRFAQPPAFKPQPIKVKLTADEPAPLNVGILHLHPFHCRWVTGSDPDGLATFCGHARSPHGGSYCDHHSIRANNVWPPNLKRRPPGMPALMAATTANGGSHAEDR